MHLISRFKAFIIMTLFVLNSSAQDNVIKLWPDGIPGSVKSDAYVEEPTVTDGIQTRFVRVTEPTLSVFLPPRARPDFSVLIYPVITFDASFTHAGSRRNLIGENPSEDAIRHFSNELQITENTPPAFLVHSGDDKAVPVKNSIVYYQGLQKYNIPSELHVFQKGGHGYGLSAEKGTQSAWPGLCISWLKSAGLF